MYIYVCRKRVDKEAKLKGLVSAAVNKENSVNRYSGIDVLISVHSVRFAFIYVRLYVFMSARASPEIGLIKS